ncbi:MAG: DUF3368 domain-containing protein [Desulfobacterales bacterium]
MMEMAVTNAGPLMVLSKLNLLHLLRQNYTEVRFPRAVYEECITNGIRYGYEDAQVLRLFLYYNQWKADEVPEIIPAVRNENLDQGEKEAISIAYYQKSILLMDEEKGRNTARSLHIPVLGSLGILIKSYRNRLIDKDQLSLYFDTISRRRDIWISPKLCKFLLEKELYIKI